MENKTKNNASEKVRRFGAFCDGLRYIVDEQELATIKQIATAMRCSTQNVYRMKEPDENGKVQQPKVVYLQNALSRDSELNPHVMQLFGHWLLDPTSIPVRFYREHPDRTVLDVDGDGFVDERDVASLAVGAIRQATEAVSTVLACKSQIAPDMLQRVDAELITCERDLRNAREALRCCGQHEVALKIG